jgi:ABC-type multidrug transport system fused ATPase/permease subunit
VSVWRCWCGRNDSVADEVRDYAAASAAGILDDVGGELDAEALAAELQDALGPLLEGVLDGDDITALCTKICRAFKGVGSDDASEEADDASGGQRYGGDRARAIHGQEESVGGAVGPGDFLVKCDGIILAYAGKALLRSSSLRLVRGRRYGLVGQNGVGKSTLLARLSSGVCPRAFWCQKSPVKDVKKPS